MIEFKTIDSSGQECIFQYEIIEDTKNEITIRVFSIPADEIRWFSYTFKILNNDYAKADTMTSNGFEEFSKKGIPEKVIEIASEYLSRHIISSPLTPQPGNFLVGSSKKVWERLVKKNNNASLEPSNQYYILKVNGVSENLNSEINENINLSQPEVIEELENSLSELLSEIALIDRISNIKAGGNKKYTPEFLVAQKDLHIKLEIYAENTQHKLPHFHILFKKIHNASYGISPVVRLAGEMPIRYEKPIVAWANSNSTYLLNAWNLIQSGNKPIVIQI